MTEAGITLSRCIQDEWLYFDEKFDKFHAWLDLLFLANKDDTITSIRGIKATIKRGQVAKSIRFLCERWRWSQHSVERFLKQLEGDEQIAIQKSNVINLISIVNYEAYSSQTDKSATQIATQNATQNSAQCATQNATQKSSITNSVSVSNKKVQKSRSSKSATQNAVQNATQKKEKEEEKEKVSPNGSSLSDSPISLTPLLKEKEEEKENFEKTQPPGCSKEKAEVVNFVEVIDEPKRTWKYPDPPAELEDDAYERFNRFYDSIVPYVSKYDKEMIREFFNYWSEPTKDGKKMRFELQKTWSVGGRLATWNRNNNKTEYNGNIIRNDGYRAQYSRREQRIADERANDIELARIIREHASKGYDGSL